MKLFAILYETISRTTRVNSRIPDVIGTLFKKMQVAYFIFLCLHYISVRLNYCAFFRFRAKINHRFFYYCCVFQFVRVVVGVLRCRDN